MSFARNRPGPGSATPFLLAALALVLATITPLAAAQEVPLKGEPAADGAAAQRGYRGETGENTVFIPRVDRPPVIEDFLSMRPTLEVRQQYALIEGFTQRIPADGEPATRATQVLVGYDDESLHVVFLAFDDDPGALRARMSRREDIGSDDQVWLVLDPFRDQQRGFEFTVNPLGIQRDGLLTEGDGVDFSYDTLWHSEGRLTDSGYVALLSIPFKSIRFPDRDVQTWGIVLGRWVPRGVAEESYWPPVSNRIEGILNQAGAITGLQDVSPGRNVRLIPYGTFRSFRALDRDLPGGPDFIRDAADPAGGVDAKMVLNDALVVDATFNPDFSQVESDQPQNTVNERFEVFFPEKRPFFLENANYFRTPINLLFTRRIGDPQLGLRTTGKVGRWAIGALAIDDRAAGLRLPESDPRHDDRARIGALRVARDVGEQSRVGAIWVDRALGDGHNRVAGVDARFKLNANWVVEGQAVHTETTAPGRPTLSGPGYYLEVGRTGRSLDYRTYYSDYDENFRADTGFVRRVGVRRLEHQINYRFWTEGDVLQRWGPNGRIDWTWDRDGTVLDLNYNPWVNFFLAGQSSIGIYASGGTTRLRPIDYPVLRADREYDHAVYGFFLHSQLLRWLAVDMWHDLLGDRVNFVPAEGSEPSTGDAAAGEIVLTFRPSDRLRSGFTWLYQTLADEPTGDRAFRSDILRGRVDYQFNRELSLRLIAQYEVVAADQRYARLTDSRNLNGDVLLTYLVNPWTSLYVGYNRNARDLELLMRDGRRTLERTDGRLVADANQVFMKVSYLFAY